MPLYEYVCQKCHQTTEALRPMDGADQPLACEHCGSNKTKRAHSVFATASSRSADQPIPMAPCARCGDPNGSCGLN